MKTYKGDAEEVTFTAPANVTSGTGVKIGDLLVIAAVTKLSGERFTGVRTGMVEHAKLSAQAWTEGQQVNWDDTNKRFTTVTTGNFRAGVAGAAAANPSATGLVILHGGNLGAALA